MVQFKTEGDTDEQPTTPSRRAVDDDLVTISFTLPRSVIDRNQIGVTVTPHLQRRAAVDQRESTLDPEAPPRTPHHRVPRFELPGQAPNARAATNNVEVGDDPFVSVLNDCGNPCVNDVAPNAVDPDDDEHDNPYLVYPLPAGRSIKELPLNATRPLGYFVVTKGKRIGVFYDVWNNIEPISMRNEGGVYCRFTGLEEAKRTWDKARVKLVLMA